MADGDLSLEGTGEIGEVAGEALAEPVQVGAAHQVVEREDELSEVSLGLENV